MKTFAAIDVGSFELSMKIFEISLRTGIREIDHIRHRIDLGTDSYNSGKLSYEHMDELCRVLREFVQIMKTYKVDEYAAYGTSAIRELDNTMIVLDQICNQTGVRIEVLSNSEQRFMDYKSIAAKGEGFQKIIENGTAIVDIGGGSIQISLFDNDSLVATQNMRLGVLRLYDKIKHITSRPSHMEQLMEEMVSNQLMVFRKLYLKDRTIQNLIIVDDYVSSVLQQKKEDFNEDGSVGKERYLEMIDSIHAKSNAEIAKLLGIAEENAPLLLLSSLLIKSALEIMGAEQIWAPGVTLCDGIAYEYAEDNKLMKLTHNFEEDIIACAKSTSKRYMGSKKRAETLEKIALTIFDSIKKVHGLGKRERLLLQIAALLHDCGKYISLTAVGECSYHIVMNTEIIGLSHMEREIVANVVMYNHLDFAYYDKIGKESQLDVKSYLTIAKLTSILRVANALDRSHKQKFKDVKTVLHEDELWIQVETTEAIELEQGLFENRAEFFEEVFNIKPVIKQKKKI